MWMHNGQISQFGLLKRVLLSSLDDDLLNFPQGQTDSEWAFALFLSHLQSPERTEPFEWKELKKALEETIRDLNRWAKGRGIKEVSMGQSRLQTAARRRHLRLSSMTPFSPPCSRLS